VGLKVNGVKHEVGPFFRNSNIAATVLGKIRLNAIEPMNSGQPFGLATAFLESVTWTDAAGKHKLKFPDVSSTLSDADLKLTII